MHREELPKEVIAQLRRGVVIPAHPLALTEARELDERHQRALTRYYLDAGAGGLAVGVHTTQFEIRDVGLYEPILRMAAETAAAWTDRPIIMTAGLVGTTVQALDEADIALGLGYHAGLLSLAAHKGVDEDALIAHCEAVAARIPLVGFYLQPAVGGIQLNFGAALPPSTTSSPSRWRRSTATAPWMWCAALSLPGPRTGFVCIPAMMTIS